jgi:uncharacterized membrane protein YsdA (DUF1294 family)
MLGVGIFILNCIGFFVMGQDKRKARRHVGRIPESALLAIALVGGSVGCIAGMFAFRHKTRHIKFRIGLPAILILQIAVCLMFAV